MIEKYYKVAEHTFRFVLPDSPKLWEMLELQYAPFQTAPVPSEALIFSLEYVEELSSGQRVCIYDRPTRSDETCVTLFRSGTDWIFESRITARHPLCSTVRADARFRCARIKLESRNLRDAVFGVNNAAMLLYALSTASSDTLEFHASVIENDCRAYLFLGQSGTGKSTHSSLWLKYIEGSELMNDDNPVVRITDDGIVRAYGSPWSGKTPCYKNVSAPVGAFVQIRQHPENLIRRQSVIEAYASIVSSVSGLIDNSPMEDGINASLDKIISSVPCYVLDCRPDEQAARVCSQAVK